MPKPIPIDPITKVKVLNGRAAADAYRTAHTTLHSKPWHKDVPKEHTPLLVILVNALEGLGFNSTEAEFEAKKTEVLAKFWEASNLLNIQELGFSNMEDFEARATEADGQLLKGMWH